MIKYIKLREWSLILAVFLTILSQAPFLRSGLSISTQSIILFVWSGVFGIAILTGSKFKKIFVSKLSLWFFGLGTVIVAMELATGNNYVNSVMIFPIIIATFFLVAGHLSADIVSTNLLYKLALAYVSATILVCIEVYVTYLRDLDFSAIQYVFKAKNSLGQIGLTAIIFLMYITKHRGYKRLIDLISICGLFMVIVLMRSRATIVSSILIPIVYLWSKDIKSSYKNAMIIVCLGFIGLILFDENLFNLLIKNVLLNTSSEVSLQQLNLYTVTSNRQDYITTFTIIMSESPIVGIGSYYMDNFFLSIMITYGIPVGIFFITYALYPIKVAFTKKYLPIQLDLAIKSISLVYVVNGLFECFAPFGPGAKTFILWFFVGILSNNKNALTNIREDDYEK